MSDEAGPEKAIVVSGDAGLVRSMAERTMADITRLARLREDTIGVVVADFEPSATFLARLIDLTPGYRTLTSVLSGEEAIEATLRLRPEVLLIDHYMNTQMSGSEASRQLRAQGYRGAVIVNSVQSDDYFMRLAVEGGADEYLVRPFTRDDLFGAIDDALLRRKHRPAWDQADSIVPRGVEARGVDPLAEVRPGRPTRTDAEFRVVRKWLVDEPGHKQPPPDCRLT